MIHPRLRETQILATFAVFASSLTAHAQTHSHSSALEHYQVESQYGLEEPVLNRKYQKAMNLEFTAHGVYAPFSTLAQYSGIGGSVIFHINERHSIEPLWYSSTKGALTSFVKKDVAEKTAASPKEMGIELPRSMYAFSYFFTPYYAKMHVTEYTVTHFDMYFGLGAALVQNQETFPDNNFNSTFTDRWGAVLTAGTRVFMKPRFAFKMELRDLIYKSKSFGSVSTDNHLQMAAGLSVFFNSL